MIMDLRVKKHVIWKEGVIDNEFLGKKSSKSINCVTRIECCIYHRPLEFGESSSSSESECDSSCDEEKK